MTDNQNHPDQLTGGRVQSAGGVGAAPPRRKRAGQLDTESNQIQGGDKPARFWAGLYSLNLMLWLLGVLVGAMVLGTVIPQKAPVEAYRHAFGAVVGPLLARSSLTNVFGAWWFSGMLALLAVNLAACAVKRLGTLARQGRAAREPLSAAQVRGWRITGTWDLGLAPDAALDRLRRALQQRGYRVTAAEARGAQMALRAGRGGARAWGPPIVHMGLVVVLIGAAFGRLPSIAFERMAVIAAGDTYQVEMGDRSFGIRLLDAGTETTPSGVPSRYWAKTQVVRGAKVVKDYTITMNHPLRYQGANVVLSSLMASGPKYAVEVTKGNEVAYVPIALHDGQVDFMGSITHLKDPRWLVWVGGFRASHAEGGPAALVRVDESGAVTENRHDIGWVGAGGLDYQGVHFELVAERSGAVAQLSVNRDPGVPVVWGGFVLVVLGCLFAFFVARRDIAATLSARGDGRTTIQLGARALGFGPGAQEMLSALGADLGAQQEVDGK